MEQRPIRIKHLTNYTSIHSYLKRYKKGKCKKCGKVGLTHLALRHGKEHMRSMNHYSEMCVRCHHWYDRTPEKVEMWKRNLSMSYTHSNPIKNKFCEECNKEFRPQKKTRRFCSNSCSSKSKYRDRLALNKTR